MQRLLVIGFILLGAQLQAQQYFFKNWNTNNGLPSNNINAIAQDNMGFMWLATEGGGLVKFDGTHFTPFTSKDGLPSDFVTALRYKDSLLYVGTEKGLCLYNGHTFKNLDHLEGFNNARINALEFSKNGIYIAYKRALLLFNSNGFTTVNDAFFNGQEIFSLDRNNNLLYLTCDSGLVTVNLKNHEVKKVESQIKPTYFFTDTVTKTHLIANKKEGIFVKSTERHFELPEVKSALALNQNTLAVGYKNGFALLGNQQQTFFDAKNGLDVAFVNTLFLDQFNVLWIGASNGLFKYVNNAISTFGAKEGLKNLQIHTILNQDKTTWLGTNNGIEVFKNDTCLKFPALDQGIVFKIVEDQKGSLWFATEQGLLQYQNGTLVNKSEELSLDNNFVFDLEVSINGGLYVAGSNTVYFIQNNKVTDIFAQNVTGFNGASNISESYDGTLWIYKIDGSLVRYKNGQSKSMKKLSNIDLLQFRINTLIALESDELLVATAENGLLYYQNQHAQFITVNNGLFSNKIFGLQRLDQSRIAVLFEKGIQLLDLQNQKIKTGQYFGTADGFLDHESVLNAISVSKNKLWIGTKGGVVQMDLNKISDQKNSFKPILTQVDLFFNPETNWQNLNQKTTAWANTPEDLILNYNQNYLTFHYTAFTSGNAQSLNFRYKLNGQDNIWTIPENRNEAIYTDISPGRYRFEIQVSNHPDFTNAQSFVLPLRIVPPFWRTYWFWILIALFLGGIAIALVRMRINQLNQKLALEAALAESERKALRLQMNPHFIFNALDSISGFIFKNEAKLAVKYLGSFAKLMRLTLETSRETLIPLETEINLLKNYLSIEQLRFSNSFDFEFNIAENIDPDEVMIPPMLVQPNLENAILHGIRPLEKQGLLTVNFKITDQHLICEIQDNGIGREKSKQLNINNQKKHKGLATDITTERIKLLSQTFEKTFRFLVEDVLDQNQSVVGTKVTLIMPLLLDQTFD